MAHSIVVAAVRALPLLIPLALAAAPARADTAADTAAEGEEAADTPTAEPASDEAPEDPSAGAQREQLTFVAAGHLRGKLAEVNCRLPAPQRQRALHYARQAGYYDRLVRSGRDPIAVSVGDTIFPGAIPRFLLQSDAAERSLAALLGEIPWAMHVFGKRELAIAKRELARFSAQAADAGVPVQAANMRCRAEAADDAFCRSLDHGPDNPPWAIAERAGLRIGIIPLLDPAARAFVAKERLELVEIAEPADVLPDLVSGLREEHEVDLVVVVHHGFGDDAFDDLHDLLSRTPGVDLALTNEAPGAGAESAAATAPRGYVVARATGAHIIGAQTGHEHLVTIDVEVTRDEPDGEWRVERLAPLTVATGEAERKADTARALRDTIQNLCGAWGEPINANASLASAFSMEDFRTFVLGIMRSAARAQVSIANTAAFRQPELFPLSGAMTFADAYTVLAYNNRLVVLELEGKELEKLGAKLGEDIVAVGLEKRDDDSIRVNGRSVIADATYRVATNSFLAAGGADLLDGIDVADTETFAPSWSDTPPTISEIVVEYVANLRFPTTGRGAKTLHPKKSFPDLHRKPLWRFRAAVDGSYNEVTVENPAADDGSTYGRPQLAVSPTSQVNIEVRGGIQADSRYHRWDNELLFQYAMARAETEGDLGPFQENKDITQLRSQYRYNGFRSLLGDAWYAPAPFAELQLETEIRVSPEQDHRRLALTGIVGPELQLLDPLTVFAGANARRDVTQPAGEFGYGLTAGYRLQRLPLFESLGTKAELESDLAIYLNRINDDREQELRGTGRLFVTIIGELSFTTTLSAFLYRRSSVGDLGFNTSFTAGLNYSWDRALQSL